MVKVSMSPVSASAAGRALLPFDSDVDEVASVVLRPCENQQRFDESRHVVKPWNTAPTKASSKGCTLLINENEYDTCIQHIRSKFQASKIYIEREDKDDEDTTSFVSAGAGGGSPSSRHPTTSATSTCTTTTMTTSSGGRHRQEEQADTRNENSNSSSNKELSLRLVIESYRIRLNSLLDQGQQEESGEVEMFRQTLNTFLQLPYVDDDPDPPGIHDDEEEETIKSKTIASIGYYAVKHTIQSMWVQILNHHQQQQRDASVHMTANQSYETCETASTISTTVWAPGGSMAVKGCFPTPVQTASAKTAESVTSCASSLASSTRPASIDNRTLSSPFSLVLDGNGVIGQKHFSCSNHRQWMPDKRPSEERHISFWV